MAALKLKTRVTVGRGEHLVGVSICEPVIQRIAEEIISSVNRRGAQWTFGVHDSTPEQLVRQHINTGGLQRCVDALGLPNASVVY